MTHLVLNYQVSINASPEAVFEYVSDFSRHGEWNEGLSVESVSDGPTTEGSEYRSVGRIFGRDIPNKIKVTAYDAPDRIAFTSTDNKDFLFYHDLKFEAQGDGTLLTRTVEFDWNPVMAVIVKALLEPLVGTPSMNKSFRNLKAKLEE